MTRRYPVGIDGIDSVLCGGIPAGQLVVLKTDSDSPGEALLRRLTLQQPTLFVSTVRIKAEVEEWLEGRQQLSSESSNPPPKSSSEQLVTDETDPPVQIVHTGLGNALATTSEQLDQLTESVNVIVDSINSLEEEAETEYLEFLQKLKRYVRETDQIVYFHVLDNADSEDEPSNRALTHKIADIVWQFSTNITADEMTHQLAITKDRTGMCSDEPFTLNIDNESDISVDTSRNLSL